MRLGCLPSLGGSDELALDALRGASRGRSDSTGALISPGGAQGRVQLEAQDTIW